MLQKYLATGYKLIFTQLVLLAILALSILFIQGLLGFTSVLLGGCAWIIPNLYFVHKLFKNKTTLDAQTLLKSFFIAEGVKLLSSIGLIIVFVLFFNIETWAFLCGYIAAIAASFLVPFWYRK